MNRFGDDLASSEISCIRNIDMQKLKSEQPGGRVRDGMETTSDPRLESTIAAKLFLELTNERSLEGAMQKVVDQGGTRPGLACVQIWRVGDGDRCSRCPLQEQCTGHTLCLQ